MRRLYLLRASAVMATTLIVVAAGASAFPSMQQKNEFLALAFSPSLQRLAIERDPKAFFKTASTLGRAQTGAYQACVDEGRNHPQEYNYDCQGVAWVQNGYLGFSAEDVGTAGATDEAYEPVWGWAARRIAGDAVDASQMQCLAKHPQYGPCRLMKPPHTALPFGRPFRGGPWHHTGPM
jgi:hypothetical protein